MLDKSVIYQRIRKVAESRGSRATTIRGLRAYLLEHPAESRFRTAHRGGRGLTEAGQYLLSRQYRRDQKKTPTPDALVAYVARAAMLDRSHSSPVRTIDGLHRKIGAGVCEIGEGYSFRWRGKWKSAPGSYIASTRCILVDSDYARSLLDRGLRRYRDEVACVALEVHAVSAGCAVQYAWSASVGKMWRVTTPDQYVWHGKRENKDHRAAAQQAVAAAADRRRNERIQSLMERADLTRIYVGIEDSVRAGNCRIGTEQFASAVREKIGGEIGAVRADVLLSIRRDSYTERAVRQALTRSVVHE